MSERCAGCGHEFPVADMAFRSGEFACYHCDNGPGELFDFTGRDF